MLFATAVCAPPMLRAESPSVASLQGFAGVHFGDSVETATAKLPAMKPLANDQKMPAAVFASPHLRRFLFEGYELEGVAAPLKVELRFWKDQLWAFLVYFEKEDAPAVLQALEKRYGERTSGVADRPIWKDGRVTLQTVSKAGWYGATSDAISEDARAWFFKALTGEAGGAAAPVAETVEKPAAAEPAEKPGS